MEGGADTLGESSHLWLGRDRNPPVRDMALRRGREVKNLGRGRYFQGRTGWGETCPGGHRCPEERGRYPLVGSQISPHRWQTPTPMDVSCPQRSRYLPTAVTGTRGGHIPAISYRYSVEITNTPSLGSQILPVGVTHNCGELTPLRRSRRPHTCGGPNPPPVNQDSPAPRQRSRPRPVYSSPCGRGTARYNCIASAHAPCAVTASGLYSTSGSAAGAGLALLPVLPPCPRCSPHSCPASPSRSGLTSTGRALTRPSCSSRSSSTRPGWAPAEGRCGAAGPRGGREQVRGWGSDPRSSSIEQPRGDARGGGSPVSRHTGLARCVAPRRVHWLCPCFRVLCRCCRLGHRYSRVCHPCVTLARYGSSPFIVWGLINKLLLNRGSCASSQLIN